MTGQCSSCAQDVVTSTGVIKACGSSIQWQAPSASQERILRCCAVVWAPSAKLCKAEVALEVLNATSQKGLAWPHLA